MLSHGPAETRTARASLDGRGQPRRTTGENAKHAQAELFFARRYGNRSTRPTWEPLLFDWLNTTTKLVSPLTKPDLAISWKIPSDDLLDA